jgi:riboflavin synthase
MRHSRGILHAMFTGLIEHMGTLVDRAVHADGQRLTFQTPLTNYVLGESIAIDGVCLTVSSVDEIRGSSNTLGFSAGLSPETLQRTTLGALQMGQRVHVERALCVGDRIGGHFVTGHVDAVVTLVSVAPVGECEQWVIHVPEPWSRLTAEKGSLALNGVSLTINAVRSVAGGAEVELMLVAHTRQHTTFGDAEVGREFNLEVDVLARYACHWLQQTAMASATGENQDESNQRWLDLLVRQGYA